MAWLSRPCESSLAVLAVQVARQAEFCPYALPVTWMHRGPFLVQQRLMRQGRLGRVYGSALRGRSGRRPDGEAHRDALAERACAL